MATEPAGTFVRIPLSDGSFGYGRVLEHPYMAFYDLRTAEPSSDLDAVEARPILFRQAVRRRGDAWPVIGRRDLTGAAAEPVVQFTQDRADWRKCTIFDTAGLERAATPQECVGLERAAVWDMPHIEERLLDTFEGRPNGYEVRARVRLGPE
ncbi:immunity 26/phosphotriesterase HocA family protein [Dactylosporangium sp. CA-139066]|uniref:immunity 26/phosphotriesterase HocA family protein n=1 Tax=Dactylosporangium sp. CA-139066 TaxID=3239930 RepID=UPI003D8B80C1